jgi:hypothetical protein
MALGRTGAAASPLLTGLVAYWKLDETSGNRLDSSGNGSTLSLLAGAVPSRSGKVNNGADFVPGNCLTCTSNSNLVLGDIDFTIAAWFWLDVSQSQTVIEKNDGAGGIEYTIVINAANQCGILLVPPGGVTYIELPTGATLNAWHFVVVQHNATTHTLTISCDNGVGSSSSVAGKPPYAGTGALTIGAGIGGGYGLDGIIDEVGIWKRVLSAGEIATLYNSGAGITHPF